MFSFDHLVRIASAAVCSLVLTTVAIGATLAPAGPASANPATYASAEAGSETAHG
jgi:hypothetical protein